jgi:hypothetical protein
MDVHVADRRVHYDRGIHFGHRACRKELAHTCEQGRALA